MRICGGVNGVAVLRATKLCVCVSAQEFLTLSWQVCGKLQREALYPDIQAILPVMVWGAND